MLGQGRDQAPEGHGATGDIPRSTRQTGYFAAMLTGQRVAQDSALYGVTAPSPLPNGVEHDRRSAIVAHVTRPAGRSRIPRSELFRVKRYYGKFNKLRGDRWVFGDRATGAYLPKPSWTEIVRHTLVKGRASPDDPDLTQYWAERRRKVKPPLDSYTVRLLTKQDGRCTLCGEDLLTFPDPPQTPKGWEWWYLWVTKKGNQRGLPRPRRQAQHATRSTNTPRTRHLLPDESPDPGSGDHRAVTAEARAVLVACLGRVRGNAHARS